MTRIRLVRVSCDRARAKFSARGLNLAVAGRIGQSVNRGRQFFQREKAALEHTGDFSIAGSVKPETALVADLGIF